MWYDKKPESVINWLDEMWNYDESAYRLSASSFYKHSIDSTSLGLDLCQMLNVKEKNLKKSLEYLNERQVKKTGFYYEDYVDTLDKTNKRYYEIAGTYLGFQTSSIFLHHDVKPKHLYDFYKKFTDDCSIKHYMTNNMPWDKAPTGAGGMVDHAATMIRCNIHFGEVEYYEVMDEMYRWLNENQNENTGLWGNIESRGLSGLILAAYHLMRGMYFIDELIPNYPEKIIDSILQSLNETSLLQGGVGEGCHDMDHFVMLERMFFYTDRSYRKEEIISQTEKRLIQLRKMVMKDGGFSFTSVGTIKNHYGYNVTSGNLESDMVGTVFYMETLLRMFLILGEKPKWNSSITHGV